MPVSAQSRYVWAAKKGGAGATEGGWVCFEVYSIGPAIGIGNEIGLKFV
jgi:hypothetical protein